MRSDHKTAANPPPRGEGDREAVEGASERLGSFRAT